jgi:hypothetical protein
MKAGFRTGDNAPMAVVEFVSMSTATRGSGAASEEEAA